MRRTILLGIVLGLVGVPALEAQVVGVPLPAERSVAVGEVVPASQATEITPAGVESLRVRHVEVEPAAVAEPTARTLLAVVGVVVLVAALISLFT
jgi:hypothetical protein